ncbi:hypothetical protein [Bacillus sp. FJAT-45066]|uniref:hypothetical protein n=1 Tax=Bacillus sp. FJAT-45066 TaxID=2011010 RepID=UPI000BB6961C|nr:hypothetical protein [Bacillus sp. FJAT-45066]
MKKLVCILFFVVPLFVACQTVKEDPVIKISNFNIDQTVTEIEVVDWLSNEHVAKVTDQDFINNLVKELSSSDNHSTKAVELGNPDYKLYFISNGEVVYELGYFNESVTSGVISRYWDYQKDGLYEIILQLPID